MKASENPSIQKYLGDVCFPIDYAEVKLGRLINTTEDKYRFKNVDSSVNPMNTRALVRTDRHPDNHGLDSILIDVHSKGRADRKYESSSTVEFDRVNPLVILNWYAVVTPSGKPPLRLNPAVASPTIFPAFIEVKA